MSKIGNKFSNISDDSRRENLSVKSNVPSENVSIFKVSRNMLGSVEDTSHFMSIFDANGDGAIDYEEFQVIEQSYKNQSGSANQKCSGMTLSDLYNKLSNLFKNGIGNDIYVNGNVVNPDGNIDEVHQSKTLADCWFLSKINALSHTEFGKAALEEARIVKDGKYGVKIRGKEYMFTVAEIQTAIDSQKYSSGDPDMIIFELAFEKYFDELLKNPENYSEKYAEASASAQLGNSSYSSLEGGMNSRYVLLKPEIRDVMQILTGHSEQSILRKSNYKQVFKMKAENRGEVAISFGSNYAITLNDGEPHIERMNPERNFGQEGHEYELKDVIMSDTGDIIGIIITNPWNNGEDICLTEEQFMQVCSKMSVTASNTDLEEEIAKINEAVGCGKKAK